MIYSGIDEAGLGPILGPFCAASTTIQSPQNLKELLKDIPKKLFYVDDSKKVYQGKYGFQRLELNVLAFYTVLCRELPQSINSFIPTLNSDWNIKNLSLPISVTKDQVYSSAESIRNIFSDRGIKLLDIKRTAVSPMDFNRLIDIWDNKSVVCQKIINPLLINCINKTSEHEIVVDKQGGRKFYKEYLDSLLENSNAEILFEHDNHSSYKTQNANIHFMAKADSNNFTVALSSMFSKYMRELAMLSFNKYWQERIQNLKPTAGYYTDGMRFISELQSHDFMPINRDSLVRKK